MCEYCEGRIVKQRVEYATKASRRAHGGSWFGYESIKEHVVFPNADNVYIDGNTLICESETEYDGRTYGTTTKQLINFCPMCGRKLT